MIKYLVLLFNLAGLFIYQVFMQSNVTAAQTAPSSADPGSSFTVEVTINKGDASGFAKYQADLPQGCTASAVNKQGATVLSSGNAIKFIWASLPADQTLKVSYTVTLDPSLTGAQNIGGKFLYVVDNQKQEADANQLTVNIGGAAVAANTTPPDTNKQSSNTTSASNNSSTSSNTSPSNNSSTASNTPPANNSSTASNIPPSNNTSTPPVVQKADTTSVASGSQGGNTPVTPATTPVVQNTAPAQSAPPAPAVGGVFVTRSLSSTSVAPGDNITVSVTIHKGTTSGFAKLEETIPAGCTVTQGNLQNATFKVVDNLMKMLWISLPADSVFTVTYQLAIGSNVSGAQSLTGQFSFVMNGQAAHYPMNATGFNVGTGGVVASSGGNTGPTGMTSSGATGTTSGGATGMTSGGATGTTSGGATGSLASSTGTTGTTAPTGTSDAVTPHVSGGSTGVSYRVQIMALHNPVSTAYFARHYSMKEHVNTEMLDGFTKYTVGRYSDYKSVRDHREEIRGMGVAGPFVVAYNSGQRITVQDALMITHNQWYQ